MTHALALLEFGNVAAGMLAVDAMLKKSPVAMLRCGSVHPGRYLALVGGSVASTDEAYVTGARVGAEHHALVDEVFLADPHARLAAAVMGERVAPEGEAVGVCDVGSSPSLLRVVDAALKAVSIGLVEVRLADDLGGHALAVFDGSLPDVQEALALVARLLGPGQLVGSTLMPRVDETLRGVLAAGTSFADCAFWTPTGAEVLQTEG